MENTVASSDSYLDKLRKTIPAEVVGLYLGLKLLAAEMLIGKREVTAAVIVDYLNTIIPFLLLVLLAAAAYLYVMERVRNLLQIAITVISLFLWAVALDLSYLSQAVQTYRLPWLFDVLGNNSVSFLLFILLWNFLIPIFYAVQGQPPEEGIPHGEGRR